MPPETLSHNTRASDPGGVRLSHAKLRRFHPELYKPEGLNALLNKLSRDQLFWRKRYEEHLMHGDSRAALVITTQPLLVAAYTDELDCIAMLQFPPDLLRQYILRVGTRLLTVNLYGSGETLAADLENGPRSFNQYNNFSPLIAEFLSDDRERIEDRKSQIAEEEWKRAWAMAHAYMAKPNWRARDGRPRKCWKPAV